MTRIVPDEHRHHDHKHHDESKDMLPILKMEVLGHLPFTILGIVFGMLLVGIGTFWMKIILTEEAFHFTHFLHIFFSGAAAAALMTFYNVSYARSIIIAMLSSIILCTISDTFIPYWGAQLMGKAPELHICATEHPVWILLVALLGTNAGLIWLKGFEHCSKWNHLIHIFISSAASGIYIFSFSQAIYAREIVGVLGILFVAIFIPCLVSDVVVPLMAVHPSFFMKKIFGKAK